MIIPNVRGPRALLRRSFAGFTCAVAILMIGCTSLRHDVQRPPSYAIENPQETMLWRDFTTQLNLHPGMSGLRLLSVGQEAFLVRAALAEAAQRTLDLQYYVVAPDSTGTLLIYRALRAAQRGVRVRLLIDDLDVGDRDSDLALLAAHPNVQVRVFNPFSTRGAAGLSRALDYLSGGARLNRRMHNKLWIADNAVALVGGRNLGDAYFNADTGSNFADLDVLAAGPVVAAASRSFDAYWNSEWSVPIEAFTGNAPRAKELEQFMSHMTARAAEFRDSDYGRALRASDLGALVHTGRLALIPAHATVLYDSPAKLEAQTSEQEGHVLVNLRQTVESTQSELVLVSPYFIPHERGVGMLCQLSRRGVRVRVLTNSLASTDVAAVYAGYARYRPRLLGCGVTLSELRPSSAEADRSRRGSSSGVSLHAKAIMVDGQFVLIGSMNLDPRSRLSNTEIAVLIDSRELGLDLETWLDQATSLDNSFRPELTTAGDPNSPVRWVSRQDDQLQHYTSEPLASWWRRMISGLLGVLVPEGLL